MKSLEWAYLLDILWDLVAGSGVSQDTRRKLARLIGYVGKIGSKKRRKNGNN